MGLTEIIFGTIMFIAIWGIFFKFLLTYQKRKMEKKENIIKGLEKTEEKLKNTDGVKPDLFKDLGIERPKEQPKVEKIDKRKLRREKRKARKSESQKNIKEAPVTSDEEGIGIDPSVNKDRQNDEVQVSTGVKVNDN